MVGLYRSWYETRFENEYYRDMYRLIRDLCHQAATSDDIVHVLDSWKNIEAVIRNVEPCVRLGLLTDCDEILHRTSRIVAAKERLAILTESGGM
ncbi:MAG: hypothetical protein ACRCWQ_13700 [Bacilli bacterium]